MSNAAGTVHEGAFETVSPREALVVVVWGAQPKPTGRAVISSDDFFVAVAQALQ